MTNNVSTCKYCKEVYIAEFVVDGVCLACQENINNGLEPCEIRKCTQCGAEFAVHDSKSDKSLCDHDEEAYHAMLDSEI